MTTPSISLLSASALLPLLDQPTAPFLLDVREPDEFRDWKIAGAVNIPLGTLGEHLDEIPTNRDVVVICARGARAQQGADILLEAGRSSLILDGGMGEWASAYDTVEIHLGGADVIQVRRRGKGCLSYVIGAGDRAVVIDPSLNLDLYIKVATDHGWSISDVVDTHLHADHISGARELVALTGATLRLSPNDPFTYGFSALHDGDDIELADGVNLTVSAVAVPGHTEGSTLYQLGDVAIFTGDTLFLESVGRPDLADKVEEFAHNLYRSLHERVLPLSDDVLVFPSHYGDAVPVHFGEAVVKSLGELRSSLPALKFPESEFVQWAVENVKDRPPNYQHIVKVNAGLLPLTDEAAELELGPNRCAIAS
jgi:glyoxylase-like metal-dependent hydrolase (beta-lactamase superfamily II)